VAGYSSAGIALNGRTFSGIGVWGEHLDTTGVSPGVLGETSSAEADAAGVVGRVTPTIAGEYSAGVRGIHNGTDGNGIGVYGAQNGGGWGVYGVTPYGVGVYGVHDGESGADAGVAGYTDSATDGAVGVYGAVTPAEPGEWSAGVKGESWGTWVLGIGVWGKHYAEGIGVLGESQSGHAVRGVTGSGTAFYGVVNEAGGMAGEFYGDVAVSGTLTKGGGSFRIDHPLDPENRYLAHSFVESPDMMNIYNGNVVTDAAGEATVALPEYFSALNRDFRYQLTVIGEFAQAIVAREVEGNAFTIRTSKGGVKVSWQVTGIRQDRWAEAHRIAVEREKPEKERGLYLHPELYGQPAERGVAAAHGPEALSGNQAMAQRPPASRRARREAQR